MMQDRYYPGARGVRRRLFDRGYSGIAAYMCKRMRLCRMVAPALFAGLILATRIPFRSHYLYDIDSVNFALGMRYFDPSVHQPHPPGYFLYILTGRLAAAAFRDANTALVAISIIASCGTAILICLLTRAWFGRSAAIVAGLMFVFSPLSWFHGTVALIYAVEAFFSALTGYLCWLAYSGNRAVILPAAFVLGIATGFRPSSFLFLCPVLLLAATRTRSQLFAAVLVLVFSLAAWIVPMMLQAGGPAAWWSSLHSLWLAVPARETVFNSSPATSVARLFSIAGILLLCFGFGALFAFRSHPAESGRRLFVWFWTAPALLFFTLIFLKSVNSGYLLVITPPLFALLGARASQWCGRAGPRAALLAVAALANSLVFLFAPVYCSWSSVRRFENELRTVAASLPTIASPDNTMIVGFDSHFLGYRHAGYYLPDWFTAEYPAVRLSSGKRIFTMEHGKTRLAETLPTGRFQYFVFFPLPAESSLYKDYFDRIRARFPAGELRSVGAGGREFVFGNISDLCVLFPSGGA